MDQPGFRGSACRPANAQDSEGAAREPPRRRACNPDRIARVHSASDTTRLPLNQMVLMVAKDKRPIFAIPRGDVVYIGTTDTRYKDPPNVWPAVFASEIEYLLAPIKDYFNVELNLDDCLSTWAGLRPLILQRGKSTREISRKDEIWVSRSGLITIAGGKLTGYRKMAENIPNQDTVPKYPSSTVCWMSML